jgi:hypothetical protein
VSTCDPLSLAFFANSAGSIAASILFDCAAFIMVPAYGFINNAGPVLQEKTFLPAFGPSSGAESLNGKHIWDGDHDAILLEEMIGSREDLDHSEEVSLGDASADRSSSSLSSSSEEEDGSDQE